MLLAWALLALVPSACRAPAPASTYEGQAFGTAPDPGAFTLGPGDRVRVTVQRHPELSTDLDGARVDPNGEIVLPAVGVVSVAGRDLATLQAELSAAYRVYMQDPVVTTTIVEVGSRSFHILGKVELPGAKTMDRPLNALEAVARGGQLTLGAARTEVFLLRPIGEQLAVHVFDVETPDARGLVQVLPGDVLLVQEEGNQRIKEEFLPFLSSLGLNALATAAVVND